MGLINWVERKVFARGLTDTEFFRTYVRRAAYALAGGDPERVHEMALEALVEFEDEIVKVASQFDFPDLHVDIAGHDVMPFGTAAGLDKNGDALYPLSLLFGYLEWGTIVVPTRPGNNRPRVAVDDANDEVFNAQGFPHKGLPYASEKVQHYRARVGRAPLLTSVCGIPPQADQLDVAHNDLEQLVKELSQHSDGFVWNPFSPNTAALTALRNPKEFRKNAELIRRLIGNKLLLVKMGPYDDDVMKRHDWLGLVHAFLEGGGNGIVAVNTYMVPKDQVPSKAWGYPSAGRSGTFLQEYRQRAVRDTRATFPNAFIIAAGGINSGEQAWSAFEAGADSLEGYTPYTFKGFGLLLEMARGVQSKLRDLGYKTLREYQTSRRAA